MLFRGSFDNLRDGGRVKEEEKTLLYTAGETK